jgi:hypothetical protein
MLAVSKLLQKLSLAPQPDAFAEELMEELQMERVKVEDTVQDMLKLKLKLSNQLKGLRAQLIARKQVPSVLRRSFTMMTMEECLGRQLPELAKSECGLTLKGLEQKVLDLEADNYAREQEAKIMAAEKQGLQEALVSD